MGRRWSLAALVVLVAMASAACGSGSGSGSEVTPGTTPSPSRGTATSPGDPSPVVADVLDFEAPLLGGGSLDGESLAGRDVAFWFWAPW